MTNAFIIVAILGGEDLCATTPDAQQLVAALEDHQVLRLSRPACGKLEVASQPECARISRPLPEPPGSSPHRTRERVPKGLLTCTAPAVRRMCGCREARLS
jgi:hypothetical protein